MSTRLFLKPYSVNGTGIRLLDYRRVSEDTYEATRWLTILFIPILPIGTLLIRPGTAEGVATMMRYSFQLLGKRPLNWRRVWRMYAIDLIAVLPVALCAWFETPGEVTDLWITMFIFSILWGVGVLAFTQHRRPVYTAAATQPMPSGGTTPRKAA
jgi:cytochrome bd-type quinol oxidase subunit 2